MSSGDPPQLHLTLPPPTQSFKRSFRELGFDVDSPTAGGESVNDVAGSSDGNERNKRARSEGLDSSSSRELPSSSSSSTASSFVASRDQSSASSMDMSTGVALRARRASATSESNSVVEANRIPVVESDDLAMLDIPQPILHSSSWAPPLSPDASGSTPEDSVRSSLDRYREFDSHISALRRSPDPVHLRPFEPARRRDLPTDTTRHAPSPFPHASRRFPELGNGRGAHSRRLASTSRRLLGTSPLSFADTSADDDALDEDEFDYDREEAQNHHAALSTSVSLFPPFQYSQRRPDVAVGRSLFRGRDTPRISTAAVSADQPRRSRPANSSPSNIGSSHTHTDPQFHVPRPQTPASPSSPHPQHHLPQPFESEDEERRSLREHVTSLLENFPSSPPLALTLLSEPHREASSPSASQERRMSMRSPRDSDRPEPLRRVQAPRELHSRRPASPDTSEPSDDSRERGLNARHRRAGAPRSSLSLPQPSAEFRRYVSARVSDGWVRGNRYAEPPMASESRPTNENIRSTMLERIEQLRQRRQALTPHFSEGLNSAESSTSHDDESIAWADAYVSARAETLRSRHASLLPHPLSRAFSERSHPHIDDSPAPILPHIRAGTHSDLFGPEVSFPWMSSSPEPRPNEADDDLTSVWNSWSRGHAPFSSPVGTSAAEPQPAQRRRPFPLQDRHSFHASASTIASEDVQRPRASDRRQLLDRIFERNVHGIEREGQHFHNGRHEPWFNQHQGQPSADERPLRFPDFTREQISVGRHHPESPDHGTPFRRLLDVISDPRLSGPALTSSEAAARFAADAEPVVMNAWAPSPTTHHHRRMLPIPSFGDAVAEPSRGTVGTMAGADRAGRPLLRDALGAFFHSTSPERRAPQSYLEESFEGSMHNREPPVTHTDGGIPDGMHAVDGASSYETFLHARRLPRLPPAHRTPFRGTNIPESPVQEDYHPTSRPPSLPPLRFEREPSTLLDHEPERRATDGFLGRGDERGHWGMIGGDRSSRPASAEQHTGHVQGGLPSRGQQVMQNLGLRRLRASPDRPAQPTHEAVLNLGHDFQQEMDVLRGDGLPPVRQQQFHDAFHRERSRERGGTARWGDYDPEGGQRTLSSIGEALRRRRPVGGSRDYVMPNRRENIFRRRSPSPSRVADPPDYMNAFAAGRRYARGDNTRTTAESLFGDPPFLPTVRMRQRAVTRNLGDYIRDEDFDSSYENLIALAASLGEVRPRATPNHVIAALPTATYKDWQNPESDVRCPICLDDYKALDPVLKIESCTHWFHKDCLEQWLHSASTCPVCRNRVRASRESRRPRSRAVQEAGPSGSSLDNHPSDNSDSDSNEQFDISDFT